VHDYAQMYGLFSNQCYMFARVVFDVIVQLFSYRPDSNTPVPAPCHKSGPPLDANIIVMPLSEQAGRWVGLLIIDPMVRVAMVDIVVARYKIERPMYEV
jgi:hypothetical protein